MSVTGYILLIVFSSFKVNWNSGVDFLGAMIPSDLNYFSEKAQN